MTVPVVPAAERAAAVEAAAAVVAEQDDPRTPWSRTAHSQARSAHPTSSAQPEEAATEAAQQPTSAAGRCPN